MNANVDVGRTSSDQSVPAEVQLGPRTGWQPRRLPLPFRILCVDIAVLTLASVLGWALDRRVEVSASSGAWLVLLSALAVLFLWIRGAYRRRLRLSMIDELRTIVAATATAAMTVVTVRVITTDTAEVAREAVAGWLLASVLLGAGRFGVLVAERRARRQGKGLRTLIIGAGHVGQVAAKRLLDQPEFGLAPVGFLDKDPLPSELADVRLPVLGASWDLDDVLDTQQIQHVVVTFSTAPHSVLLRIVRQCQERRVGVSMVPRLFERMTDRLAVDRLGGLPIVSVFQPDPYGRQFAVKYAIDRVVAVATVVALSPVLLLAALATLLSLGRPILYRQVRVGRDGRPFEMLKFRTMREGPSIIVEPVDLVVEDTAPGGVEGEDRRTRIGSVLRATSIDELPQLFNVLRGEMSLVGPRPERPEFVDLFETSVPRYDERLRVKSGITGWAQVHGLRGKTSLADRVEWDNYYIENWSLWLDFKILLLTLAVVFKLSEGE